MNKWRIFMPFFLCALFLIVVLSPQRSNDLPLNILNISGSLKQHEFGEQYHDISGRAVMNTKNMLIPESIPEDLISPRNLTRPSVKLVLLLSSVGRSGSSFLGEILSSQGNNIYLYEPVRAVPKEFHNKKFILELLLKNFHCEISREFMSVAASPYVSVRHPSVFQKKLEDIKVDDVRSACLQEHLRIIKTIRTRVSWAPTLLEDTSMDWKIIHLVRDPRGSLASMKELDWDNSVKDVCLKIKEDLELRPKMEQTYPDKYHFVKYEDLCLDPFGQTQEIYRFLNSEKSSSIAKREIAPLATRGTNNKVTPESYPDIPKNVFNYLQSHIHVNMLTKVSPWTTKRDTSAHFQKWRREIDRMRLKDVEVQCRDVIQILGHRIFGSHKNVRNFSLPLFL